MGVGVENMEVDRRGPEDCGMSQEEEMTNIQWCPELKTVNKGRMYSNRYWRSNITL